MAVLSNKAKYFLAAGALMLVIAASVLTVVLTRSSSTMSPLKTQELTIRTTWNNQTVPADEEAHIRMTLTEKQLLVSVEAKFYNDPELPNWIDKPATHPTLYDFEVVELFLLGPDEHYLEIELGPKGQYFVLELHGARNATRYPIEIDEYHVINNGNGRWSATAHIDRKELPDKIEKLNAFAIHGTNETRVYMSLYPAPENDPAYPQADFHRLELFQPTDFFKTD